jgi:hypothetical protein
MRIYKFGRDHILKKVRGFMLGDDGFWVLTTSRLATRDAPLLAGEMLDKPQCHESKEDSARGKRQHA